MTTDAASPSPAATRRYHPVVVVLVVGITMAVLAAAGWATQQGYLPPLTGYACSAVGYDPVPSYESLVTDYDLSPVCARDMRGETWF